MEYCPARSPLSASSRFPGRARSVSSESAAFRIDSLVAKKVEKRRRDLPAARRRSVANGHPAATMWAKDRKKIVGFLNRSSTA
jgi:hypothetical protein